jgi:hypothetical protein
MSMIPAVIFVVVVIVEYITRLINKLIQTQQKKYNLFKKI